MEIANLKAFVQVADQGSFSDAAVQLHLTQPAVSKRVAALESRLRAKLFDRIGRRVVVTEAGRTLLPRARRILAELRASERAIRNLSGEISGPLIIGTSHHVGLHRLPPLLKAFVAAHPAVELDIRFLDSEVILGEVEHGELELGIATLPPEPPPGIDCTRLWTDQLVVAAHPQHPLAARDTVSVTQLAAHRAILPGTGTYTRRIIDHAMRQQGIELDVGLATNYLETIKMMVSVGLGWSILPRQMLGGDCAAMTVDGIDLCRHLGVIRNKAYTLSNAAHALLDTMYRVPLSQQGL